TSEEEPTPLSYISGGNSDALSLLADATEFYGVNLVGQVNSETDNEDPVAAWGDAYCPLGVPLCVRPLAVEYEGETAIIVSEAFGIGDQPFYPENSSLRWNVELYSEFDSQHGSTCRNSFDRVSGYRQGFGHLSFTCVNLDYLDEEPLGVEVIFRGSTSGTARFPLGDPLPRTEKVTLNGTLLEIGKAYPMDVFEVTINSLEELDDSILLNVTVTNLTDRKQGIDNPDWILVGQALSFYTADRSGLYKGWMASRMNEQEVVGGVVNPERTVTGAVVLEKASENWQLVMKYGSSINAVYQVLDPPAETTPAVDEG
ncbi:MAG: hypothetical protein AAF633_23575, partial [Chloroflexota bacterium]